MHVSTRFPIGILPIRCLGIPSVTRKLSVKDCNALIEKIETKLATWSNKKLNYGGGQSSSDQSSTISSTTGLKKMLKIRDIATTVFQNEVDMGMDNVKKFWEVIRDMKEKKVMAQTNFVSLTLS
ncbi:hypothetical protein V6N13_118024 [Hibiscus sabdariffa]